MADKLIFLSHIHEETALAELIKNALVDEFSGFVDIFVSSDGTSISAGSNFLKRIEDSLVRCVGAVYLISPVSVERNWISFELGAVWIRNIINLQSEKPEIPTLPVCHSGMLLSSLPLPLNNLNAITASQSSELERAFLSLQSAVGGSGNLKTDFDDLASKVLEFEDQYTLGSNLGKMLSIITQDMREVIKFCESESTDMITIKNDFVETSNIRELRRFEANELRGYITVFVGDSELRVTRTMGAINGSEASITIPVSLVLRFKEQLMA